MNGKVQDRPMKGKEKTTPDVSTGGRSRSGKQSKNDGDIELTYIQHLSELRKRLIISFASVVVGTVVAFLFVEDLASFFLTTTEDIEFVYLSPPELFLTYLKISVILGVMATAPVILYQVWVFVRPALTGRERIYVFASLVFGAVFFYVGVLFSFKVILPITIEFFLKYATGEIQPLFSIGSFVGFQLTIVVAFGASFELPILVMVLTRIGLIGPEVLKKGRLYALLVIFILAALLTPPDVVSQMLLGGPMYALFELSILISSLLARWEKRQELDDEEDGGTDSSIPETGT